MDLYQLYSVSGSSQGVKTGSVNTPNIVLITLDTVRSDRLSVYDPKRQTSPNLKKLAEQGALFHDAVSSSSWTLPGHAGLFTGKSPSQHNAHGNHQVLDESHVTLAERLLERGYNTGGFVSGPYCKAKFGLAQGFQVYKDRLDFFEWNTTYDIFSIRRILKEVFPTVWKEVFQADGERIAPEVNADALRWLDSLSNDSPFFLFLNYYDAHDPYVLGEEFLGQFTDQRRPYSEVDAVLDSIYYGGPRRFEFETVSEDLRQYMLALYDAEIFYLDLHVGKLMASLRERGVYENTIFVITSDHGEEFFEHGGVLHRQTLFEEVLAVPLFIFGPGVEPQEIDQTVGTPQLFSTVLELAGVQTKETGSLVPLMQGTEESPSSSAVSELYGNRALGAVDIVSITTAERKLIEVSEEKGRLQSGLFDRVQDPEEKQSLLEQHADEALELRRKLKLQVGKESWFAKE
jgi:arylsulfatase A-like enzyme